MIGQQAEDAVALAPNGNIKEGMQTNVEVGEASTTIDVCRIEAELQRTIDMIKDQEIVVHGQENANGNVDLHAQINCSTHPFQLRGWVGFFLSNL